MKLLITEEQYKAVFENSPIASDNFDEKIPLIKNHKTRRKNYRSI